LNGPDTVGNGAGSRGGTGVREFAAFDVIVNVQGDEPFVPASALTAAVERVAGEDDIGTAARWRRNTPLTAARSR